MLQKAQDVLIKNVVTIQLKVQNMKKQFDALLEKTREDSLEMTGELKDFLRLTNVILNHRSLN